MFSGHFENSSGESDIVISVYEDFQVHHFHQLFVAKYQMAFDNDHTARLNMLCICCSDHLLVVVNWLVEWLPLNQSANSFVH